MFDFLVEKSMYCNMAALIRRSRSVVACFIVLLAAAPRAQPVADVRFDWAMAVLSTEDGREVLAPLTSRTMLRAGDRLKLMVRLAVPSFLYVMLRAQSGTATLLSPATLPTSTAQPADTEIFVPHGINWFHAGRDPATNTLYVIVSAERLPGFEAAFSDRREVPAEPVMAELNRIRTRMGTLRTVAERPADIGGRRRATDYESRIAAMATESSGSRLVVKTFVIERR